MDIEKMKRTEDNNLTKIRAQIPLEQYLFLEEQGIDIQLLVQQAAKEVYEQLKKEDKEQ